MKPPSRGLFVFWGFREREGRRPHPVLRATFPKGEGQTIDKPWGCIEGAVAPSIVIRRRRHVRRRGAAESRFLYQFAAVK